MRNERILCGQRQERIYSEVTTSRCELVKGKKVSEVCKLSGMSTSTYYQGFPKVGGMAPEMAKDLKALLKEHR